jgi:hypothetical protein
MERCKGRRVSAEDWSDEVMQANRGNGRRSRNPEAGGEGRQRKECLSPGEYGLNGQNKVDVL